MQTIELIEEELKQLKDEQIDIVYSFISKFNSKGIDPIFSDKTVFDGKIPEDISLNHDSYLYGKDV